MPLEVAILGYTAAVLEILMGMPQAVQSFRQRKDFKALSGVSLPSALMMLAHSLLWCVYALLVQEWPVLLAHAVSVPVFAATSFFVARARLRSKSEITA